MKESKEQSKKSAEIPTLFIESVLSETITHFNNVWQGFEESDEGIKSMAQKIADHSNEYSEQYANEQNKELKAENERLKLDNEGLKVFNNTVNDKLKKSENN